MERNILGVVEIPPSTNLIHVLSNAGYTIETAIADIVDNSIANHAKNIYINLRRKGKDSTVEILDDGDGMDDETLQRAMAFADKGSETDRSEDDLGRYGVGMKTASSSFCNVLHVESKTIDSDQINAYEFPFQTNEWKIYKVECDQKSIKTKSGTKLIWQDLKLSNDPIENERILVSGIDAFSNITYRVSIHLSKTFGIYINDGLNIYVNDDRHPIEGWNPFNVPGMDVSVAYEESLFSVGNHKVRVKGFVLPVWDRMNEKQQKYVTCFGNSKITDFEGFYVYRNNRLIVSGGWLGIQGLNIGEKYNYARIGIWLDSSTETDKYFRINFAKNSINVTEEFANYIIKAAKIVRSKSINSYNYKLNPRPYKRHSRDDDVSVWDVTKKQHTSVFTINKNHPLVQQYTEGLDKRKVDALFNLLAREFPFNELKDSAPEIENYSDEELKAMLKDSYDTKMESKTISKNDIIQMILKEKPFCDERYHNKCIVFLNIIKGDDDDA